MSVKHEQEYNKDFYAWVTHNAELMRQGRFSEIDTNHIIEELESMGKSERRELVNRLALLLSHLLKWHLQPGLRGNSWKYTIKEQRIKIFDLLEDSPSLNHELALKVEHAYEQAVIIAMRETGLEEDKFPRESPFTLSQCLDDRFLPE
ncbi:MAG: hypothetical protein BGO67_00840 [Alphaproteobacteria bacterium 41-28]|nr:MAG: hypothetical protein BGO67_00840 [Alphaproteobacteria bacterium 41-28]